MFDPDDLTPDEIRQVAEIYELDRQLDDEQRALEKLEHDDPVGMVWFGDRDDWIDSRLSRKRDCE